MIDEKLPIFINWDDYGFWKNWVSPWGDISLEQRPAWCNRGRIIFKTLTEGAVNLLFNQFLSGTYFFDERRALSHLKLVVKLAQTLTDEQLRSMKASDSQTRILNLQTGFCECFIYSFKLEPIDVEVTGFDVAVNPDKLKTFVVDWADAFPRHYLDRNIAYQEMMDWVFERSKELVG